MLIRSTHIDEYGNELGQWHNNEEPLTPYENCIAEDCYNQGWHARNAIEIAKAEAIANAAVKKVVEHINGISQKGIIEALGNNWLGNNWYGARLVAIKESDWQAIEQGVRL